MPLRSKENSLGAWAFLIGVILAIIIGLITSTWLRSKFPEIVEISPIIYSVLVILGIIVGFMNVTGRDSQTFLIAGAVLVIASKFGMDAVSSSLIGVGVGEVVRSVFGALLALFVPATIIVALKTVFSIANVDV